VGRSSCSFIASLALVPFPLVPFPLIAVASESRLRSRGAGEVDMAASDNEGAHFAPERAGMLIWDGYERHDAAMACSRNNSDDLWKVLWTSMMRAKKPDKLHLKRDVRSAPLADSTTANARA
jgi:hypothetical protein